jgi:hypothetical protein
MYSKPILYLSATFAFLPLSKTFMRIRLIIPAMGLLLLAGCNSNPGWDGLESQAKPDLMAKDACACIYEIMDADPEFDVDEIIATLSAYNDHQKNGGTGAVADKFPDIATALTKIGQLGEQIDGSPCMADVDDRALNQGVPIEDIFDSLDKHCVLSLFYN